MAIENVHPSDLISGLANDFEKNLKMQKPNFADYVKTGVHRERAPTQENWYYLRLGSLLYRIYKDGPVGVQSLRSYYGGRQARGVRPHRHRKASGKVIRFCLQELEKVGFIEKFGKKGRKLSKKGQSFLYQKAKQLTAQMPEILAAKEEAKIARVKKLETISKQAPKEDASKQFARKGKKDKKDESSDSEKGSKNKK
ncbi:MAG: 40S ribosomal protein S19 [Candidatus Diapherotrites archaeon]|nr:40S ribosomal protein S19 [Candidatus Diapherotrites archaeon]